jgi:hypothetical protein
MEAYTIPPLVRTAVLELHFEIMKYMLMMVTRWSLLQDWHATTRLHCNQSTF